MVIYIHCCLRQFATCIIITILFAISHILSSAYFVPLLLYILAAARIHTFFGHAITSIRIMVTLLLKILRYYHHYISNTFLCPKFKKLPEVVLIYCAITLPFGHLPYYCCLTSIFIKPHIIHEVKALDTSSVSIV